MTGFERQVAAALQSELSRLLVPIVTAATKIGEARDVASIEFYKAELGDACDALADMLRVRVAAAINQAARYEDDRAQAAALVALGGQDGYDPFQGTAK